MAAFTIVTTPDNKAFKPMAYVFSCSGISQIVCSVVAGGLTYEKIIQPSNGTVSIDISRYVQGFTFTQADVYALASISSSGMYNSYTVTFTATHTGGTIVYSDTNYSIAGI